MSWGRYPSYYYGAGHGGFSLLVVLFVLLVIVGFGVNNVTGSDG